MRLTEDRINAIAYKVAFELVKKRYLKTESGQNLNQVTTWVEKPILEDLRQEEQLEEEVRRLLATMTTCPPEGSFEYQALYQRRKEELASRRGYDL